MSFYSLIISANTKISRGASSEFADASGTESPSLKRSVLWDPAEATATRPLAVKNVGESGNTVLRYRVPSCVIMTMGLKISKTFCRIFQRSS